MFKKKILFPEKLIKEIHLISDKYKLESYKCVEQSIQTYDQVASDPIGSLHALYDLTCRRKKEEKNPVGHAVITMVLEGKITSDIFEKLELLIDKQPALIAEKEIESTPSIEIKQGVFLSRVEQGVIPNEARQGKFSEGAVNDALARMKTYANSEAEEECRGGDDVFKFEIGELAKPLIVPYQGFKDKYPGYNEQDNKGYTVV